LDRIIVAIADFLNDGPGRAAIVILAPAQADSRAALSLQSTQLLKKENRLFDGLGSFQVFLIL